MENGAGVMRVRGRETPAPGRFTGQARGERSRAPSGANRPKARRLAGGLLLALSLLVFESGWPCPASSRTLGSVDLPEVLAIEGCRLVLNGAEYRKRFGLKIYACGLYLTARSSDWQAIVAADEPMAVRMHFVFDVSRAQMIEMMDKGFRNATRGNIAPISKNIESLYAQVPERLFKGDVVDLVYVPRRGVICHVNGAYRGESPGLAFKQAVFGIWLGEKPIAEYLKNGMLGK